MSSPSYNHEYWQRLKMAVINKYGGKCTCCGIMEPVFLALHHVHGGGEKERRSMHTRDIYQKALKRKTGRYGLLCHNCNHAMRMGTCPHAPANAG